MALIVFRVCSGSRAGQRLNVSAWPFVMGRAETCDLRLNSNQVSRLHCELRHEPNGIVVRDLRSRNGTFVNGTRIEEAMILNKGDRLRVGEMELEVLMSPVAETTVLALPAAEPTSIGVDPNRMTLDELVQFDDELLSLESDTAKRTTTDSSPDSRQSPPGKSIGSFGTTIIDPKSLDTTPPAAPTSNKPTDSAEFTSDAARQALKQLFRRR